jgi:hypothetical protein
VEDARLNHLLNLYFDGTLTGAEKTEFEQTLKESAAARRTFWEFAILNALTHEAAKLKWAGCPEESEQAAASSTEEAGAAWRRVVSWWFGRRRRWCWGLAMASALAMACVLVWYPDRNVADLTLASGAEWASGTNGPKVGAELAPGWLHLKEGAVQITFHRGASVLFEAPAEFRVVSENEAACRLGRFRVHVPEPARGFKVKTAGLDIVDLGTGFGLSLPQNGPPEVHVFYGRVDLTRQGPSFQTLELMEGEAVRVEPDTFGRMEASHTGFLNETSLVRRDVPDVLHRYEAWKEASRALTADPATVLHYTFEDQPFWTRVLTNQVRKAPVETHGSIVGCEWVEGRWPGKKALEFKRSADRVRLQLPQSLKAVSCLVWARVDGLPNGFVHSLMTGDSEEPGTLRWTISQEGNLRLGIANKSTNPEASWSVGISPPVVKKDRLGRWLMLATVYDGKTVFHYLDGQLVWSGPVAGPGDLKCGWVELGNWVATPDHPGFQWAKSRANTFFNRNFGGRMDEVAVLSRAMQPGEIQRFYEAGRPVGPVVGPVVVALQKAPAPAPK